jgi:hypothetical protein
MKVIIHHCNVEQTMNEGLLLQNLKPSRISSLCSDIVGLRTKARYLQSNLVWHEHMVDIGSAGLRKGTISS